MGSLPAGSGLGLVGGRFWALANDDDDLQNTPAASPTPSDIVCESILVGYSEEQVAESIDGFVPDSDPAWEELTANDEDRVEVLRRVIYQRTSANAVRPWKGPLPKRLHLRRQDLLLGYLLQWWLARGRIFSELRCLLVRGAALLVLEKVVLVLIIAVAAVDSMDTEVMQIIGTSLPVVQVVVGRIGTPEEVLGEEPINGIVPSSHPKIPDFAPWSYDGVHYDLEVEVEKVPQNEPNDDDILMADGEDRDKDHEDANDQHSDQSRDNTNPHASSNKEKPLIGGASSTSKLPMETLRFGSFDVTSTPYNLGSEFVQKEANEQAPFVSIQRSVSTSKMEVSTHLITQENRKASSAVPLARRAEPLHMLEHDNTQEACCQISPTSPIERDVPSIMRDSKQEASRPSTPVSSHSLSNSKQQVISSKYDNLVEETTSDQHFDSVVTGKTHNEITNDDVISFGGIPDPTSCDRRFSQRIQEKPDADDMLIGRAMRAAKLRDAETTSGLSIDQTASILNLSESEILNNASDIGVSMGTSSKNIANVVYGEFSVKFRVRSKVDGFKWALVAVYGAAQLEFKPDFLADLVRICGDETLPIMVGGDFNIIRRQNEKNNDNFDTRWSTMFNMVIESLNLREIHLSDRQYTWANSLTIPTYEKLDRVLTTVEWEQKYPLVTVQALQRAISDHTPLLVDSGEANHRGNKNVFSFELSWFEREGFMDLITKEWGTHLGGSTSVEIWQNKIRNLRRVLRGWAKNQSGIYKKEKERLTKLIDELDVKAESAQLNSIDRNIKMDAEIRLQKLLREEEMKWALRAKVMNVVHGDDNTKFFHMIANGKHRKKIITQLEQDEGTIIGHENLKVYISEYYRSLFGAPDETMISLDETNVQDIPQLNEQENEVLSARFTEQELQLFHLNFGTITLLPKKVDAMRIQQFRPICLLNVSFKIFTKTSTNRLTKIADSVVQPAQSPFMPGRHILEGVVVLHETLHEIHTKKLDGVIFKVDFEKAYDKVKLARWDMICRPKDQGGLGIENLEVKNKCLLSKWLYRISTETEGMWIQILRNKYLTSRTLAQATVILRATSWIRTWSSLSLADNRELMGIGCNRWEMAARVIFNRLLKWGFAGQKIALQNRTRIMKLHNLKNKHSRTCLEPQS
ncbi:uncharacterized protein LOC123397007 [Hordeum vulgare subsp. vulgare]|uniref:uncharacterized protein LOC123397007 n=1 Tax=Hordeum vulgare subsp. vulgare TaxID=112509 RepID=UPI001D1A5ABF|nr:uncharacterized protein LOC123397007 [Hordeum vulgare subsp. vulgare]